jgi:putative NADPH-quinone reductase
MALHQLQKSGHEVRHHDLYEEAFNPVFTPYERLHHVGNIDEKLQHLPELAPYVENLQWCDALLLVYPTWWGAQPAILKGWIDRVFMNEVAWALPDGEARLRPLLTNVRHLVVLTTHGSRRGRKANRHAFNSYDVSYPSQNTLDCYLQTRHIITRTASKKDCKSYSTSSSSIWLSDFFGSIASNDAKPRTRIITATVLECRTCSIPLV